MQDLHLHGQEILIVLRNKIKHKFQKAKRIMLVHRLNYYLPLTQYKCYTKQTNLNNHNLDKEVNQNIKIYPFNRMIKM